MQGQRPPCPLRERIDTHRRGERSHLGFGYGIHQSVGQTLARLEPATALRRLTERLPPLRQATPIAALPFKFDALFYGLYELPVSW